MAGITPRRACAETGAEALLRKCILKESRLRTLKAQGHFWRTAQGKTAQGDFNVTLGKSNLARYDYSNPKKPDTALTLISDGKQMIFINAKRGRFAAIPIDPREQPGMPVAAVITPISGGIEATGFFYPQFFSLVKNSSMGMKISGSIKIDGMKCRILSITTTRDSAYKIYIGSDGVIYGGVLITPKGGFEVRLSRVKVNRAAPKRFFLTGHRLSERGRLM